MNKLFFIIIALLISSMELTAQSLSTDYVNPFVGTAEHGHTFPVQSYLLVQCKLVPIRA